jgi:hypothetical protein
MWEKVKEIAQELWAPQGDVNSDVHGTQGQLQAQNHGRQDIMHMLQQQMQAQEIVNQTSSHGAPSPHGDAYN